MLYTMYARISSKHRFLKSLHKHSNLQCILIWYNMIYFDSRSITAGLLHIYITIIDWSSMYFHLIHHSNILFMVLRLIGFYLLNMIKCMCYLASSICFVSIQFIHLVDEQKCPEKQKIAMRRDGKNSSWVTQPGNIS